MQSGKGVAFQVLFQFGEENIQAFEVVYDIGKLLSHVFRKKKQRKFAKVLNCQNTAVENGQHAI